MSRDCTMKLFYETVKARNEIVLGISELALYEDLLAIVIDCDGNFNLPIIQAITSFFVMSYKILS